MLENVKVSSNINLKEGQMRYDMSVIFSSKFPPFQIFGAWPM